MFQRLRRQSQISDQEYLDSIGPDSILNLIWSNNYKSLRQLCSSGKSGSLFYYTEDQKYMIKTIRRTEFRKLKAMLRSYYEHIEANPSSLVTRIYGLHMIKWKSFGIPNKKYLVVMANIFEDMDVGDRFDLKGSTVDRKVLRDEAEYYNKKRNPKIELKD